MSLNSVSCLFSGPSLSVHSFGVHFASTLPLTSAGLFPGHLRYPPEINYHLYVVDSDVYTSNSNFLCGIRSLMLSCQPHVSAWTCRTEFITLSLASTQPPHLLYFLSQFTYWDMASIFSRPEISSWFPPLTHPSWGRLGLLISWVWRPLTISATIAYIYPFITYVSPTWYSDFCVSPSLQSCVSPKTCTLPLEGSS